MKINRYHMAIGVALVLLVGSAWALNRRQETQRQAACAETHYFFTMSNGDKLITVHNPGNLMRFVGSPCEYPEEHAVLHRNGKIELVGYTVVEGIEHDAYGRPVPVGKFATYKVDTLRFVDFKAHAAYHRGIDGLRPVWERIPIDPDSEEAYHKGIAAQEELEKYHDEFEKSLVVQR